MLRGVLNAIIALVFFALFIAPVIVIVALHLTSGRTRGEKAAHSRAQQLHDLALQRQSAGMPRDPDTSLRRQLLLDDLAARYPRDKPLQPSRRELYSHLTPDELEELIKL